MKTLQARMAETKASVHCLTLAGAKALMAEHPEAVRIDVRESGEAAEKRVEGFINIPRGAGVSGIGAYGLHHCAYRRL